MIDVYEANNKNFSKMGDMVLKPTKCTISRKLNIDSQSMVFELEMEHLFDKEKRWEFLKPENIIRAPTPGGKQLFRIYKVNKSKNSITVNAKHVFFDTENFIIIDDTKNDLSNNALKKILDTVLEGTGFTHNITTGNFSGDAQCLSVKDFLLSDYEDCIKDDYNLDVDNFNIKLLKKPEEIGVDSGVRADFGYNIKEIQETIDYSDLCTQIVAYATESDGTKWSTKVNSDLLDNYSQVYSKPIDYSSRFSSEEDWDDVITLLETGAKLTFKKESIDIPKVNYSVDLQSLRSTTNYSNYLQLEKLQIGDIVHCRNMKLNITTDSKLISYEYNAITQKYISQELGDFIPNFIQKLKAQKTR